MYKFRMVKQPAMYQLFVVVLACGILFVGVTSQAGRQIRLQGGLSRCQGRLEVFVPDRSFWNTACDETFGEEEARAVCRQLGCEAEGATRRPVLDFGVLPRPNGRDRFFFPFNRICDGNEATSEDCRERRGTCARSTVVRDSIAVSCGGENTEIPSPRVYDEAVRLQGGSRGLEGSGSRGLEGNGSRELEGSGSSECEGRLELYIARSGLWGTACDRNFGTEEAAVVCRQLGCGTQGATRTSVQDFGPIPRRPGGGRTFRLFEYRCNGRETRIEYCAQTTAACSLRTVDSRSIGVICGSLVDEGEGDVTVPGPINKATVVHAYTLLLLSLFLLAWMFS